MLTGYGTSWKGEAEISAWEIATHCRGFVAAWVLNLWAMWTGLFFAPRAVWQAFLRGRQSKNLYSEAFNDDLLALRVGETQRQLGLDQPRAPSHIADRVTFAAAILAGSLAVLSIPLALAAAALWAF